MNIKKVLTLSSLMISLTGCPDGNSQSSNRTTGAVQVAGEGTVVSGEQTSANAESPAGVKETKQEKIKKQEPKKVGTKTIGDVAVHADKVTVPESVAKNDNISVAIEPAPKKDVLAEAEGPAETEFPAESVPVAEISGTELAPDSEYVIVVVETAPNGEKTVVEEKKIVTLAQEPEVSDVNETQPGEFQLTLETGSNPPETVYTIAVIETATDEVVAWVNPSTGLPVKTDEEKWAPVASEASADDGSSEAVVLVKDLGLDSDLIEFAVQAKNQAGDETVLSESMPPVKPDLLSSGDHTGSDDSGAGVQVVVPSDAPVPLVNQIASARDDIKELRARIKKLKTERKELVAVLKKLNAGRKELAKEAKKMEKDKKAEKNEHGKIVSELAKTQKEVAGVKAKTEKLKGEVKELQKILSARTAELKKLKKQRQAEKLSRKS